MKKKICVLVLLLLFISCLFYVNELDAFEDDVIGKLDGMDAVSTPDGSSNGKGIPAAINQMISILQYAGSGIALIVITILGMKYILASPSEKADVKKSIMPIAIGCFLLFGGVNIAKLIAEFSDNAIKE